MLFSRCSLEIQNHYKTIQGKFSGTSKIIQNDIIFCISKLKIVSFILFKLMTQLILPKKQCSVILRYVTKKSELVERFFVFHNVSEDRTAEGLFNLINLILQEFNIEQKLVGQCYDGASVMVGNITGLQARIKTIVLNALFTHCLAHRLNLVLQHGCSLNEKCHIFFANMTGISAYFHNSTCRSKVTDELIGKRILQFVQTR